MDLSNDAASTESKINIFELDKDVLGKTYKIQQSLDCPKKGPTVILRSTDLNGIKITRKSGEGSKPLFERTDVVVNTVKYDESNPEVKSKYHKDVSAPSRCSADAKRSSPLTLRKFIANYRNRGEHVNIGSSNSTETHGNDKNARKDLESRSNVTDKPHEKKPYFSDPVRERDRLKRLYGISSRRRSRSRTPVHSRRQSPVRRHFSDNSPRRRRSKSRDKHRCNSPYRSSERDYRDMKSHRRSYSRSPNREYSNHKTLAISSRKRERDNYDYRRDNKVESTPVMQAGPYIPVPVPVADYAYSYPPWPVHTPPPHLWGPPRPPPTHYGHYPMVPLLPTMRPHQLGYGGLTPAMPMAYAPMPVGAYRPRPAQRYPTPRQTAYNFHPRQKKP